MARGFLYLVAIMDWYSRYVLAWRLSNTLETDFCVEALEEALRKGVPEMFNTDQGAQFTSQVSTGLLEQHGVRISMDGKGGYTDNLFMERLWRSLKYEEVYLKAYAGGKEARAGIGGYFDFYNEVFIKWEEDSHSGRSGRIMETLAISRTNRDSGTRS
jgi:putative transposase